MSFDNTSVLVVDDEPDLRTLYELTLLREGYRVHTLVRCRKRAACCSSNRSTF